MKLVKRKSILFNFVGSYRISSWEPLIVRRDAKQKDWDFNRIFPLPPFLLLNSICIADIEFLIQVHSC